MTSLAMKRPALIASIFLALACFAAEFASAEAETVKINQIPSAARKTIESQVADGKVVEIEKDEEDGDISYIVQTTDKAGQEREITVADDGTLLSVEVRMAELPPEVRKAITAQVGSGKLESIGKTFKGSQVSFEVEMTRADGANRSFTVDSNGKLTSLQVSLEEIPGLVRKTIEAHVGDGKLEAVYRLTEGGETSFDAEVLRHGKTRDIIVNMNGKLESVQVSIDDLSPEAQKTIRDKVGSGKIVRVDKLSELRQGVQPYEIEARKDGKVFSFAVGPKGRLLGRD